MALVANDKNANTVVLRFGAGLNSQAVPADVNPRECVAGVNFDLAPDNTYLRPRRGIYNIASTPIANEIRGFAQLVKSDATRSFLVQSGPNVYQWDGTRGGSSGMTLIGAVPAAARMRGKIEYNSTKDDKVIITDLEQAMVVQTWDGTTFTPLVTNLGSDFYARYCAIDRERAWYANVKAGTALPHVTVASQQNTLGTLTTANKPSSSLSAADTFYLPMPNNAPIAGVVAAFGKLAFATKSESWFQLVGLSATDHALELLYGGATGSGAEEVEFVGNDIVFGKQGGIDALSSTERYGDVKGDDLTRWIANDVMNIPSWTLVYSKRFDKLYCIPQGGGKIYVLHKAFLDARTRSALFGRAAVYDDLSPWSVWQTSYSTFDFNVTAAMRMYDPVDGLEYVFLGDNAGNIWQVESGKASDTATGYVTMTRTSVPIRLEPAVAYSIKGWLKARKIFAGTITLSLLVGGREVFNGPDITVTLNAAANAPVFGSGSYFGGSAYFGVSFEGRLARYDFDLPASGDEFQVKVTISSQNLADYSIEEIGLQFTPEG